MRSKLCRNVTGSDVRDIEWVIGWVLSRPHRSLWLEPPSPLKEEDPSPYLEAEITVVTSTYHIRCLDFTDCMNKILIEERLTCKRITRFDVNIDDFEPIIEWIGQERVPYVARNVRIESLEKVPSFRVFENHHPIMTANNLTDLSEWLDVWLVHDM